VIGRLLGLAAAALVVVSVVLYVWAPFATSRPGRADAIVALAGSASRLPVALRLWRDGVAPWLVVSEDAHDPRRVAFCAHPPARAICFAAEPSSTRGEARAAARLARARRWHTLAVVSSRFHLFRARLLFRRCTSAHLELVPAPVEWWRWALNVPVEWAKLAVAETTRRGC